MAKVKGAIALLLLVAAIVAGEALQHIGIWAIVVTAACFLIAFGIVTVLALLMTRPLRQREQAVSAELERTRPARLAAAGGAPQIPAAAAPPAIETHYHLHLHGDAAAAARVIGRDS